MNRFVKKQWVMALRSGEYQQGRSELRTPGNKFCCLGVLCDVVDPRGWGFNNNHDQHGSIPSDNLLRKVGLTESRALEDLVDMNDNRKATFFEIADWIEDNL